MLFRRVLRSRWAACAGILTLALVATTVAQQATSGWAAGGLELGGLGIGILAGKPGTKSARPTGQSLNTHVASVSTPGWLEPTVVHGSKANLDPKAVVVGVRMNGKARAYTLPVGAAGQDVLIRDTLGGQEISIGFSGHGDQVVVLKWLPDGRRTRYPFQVVSWQKWLTDHPRTEVAVAAPSVAGMARPDMAPSV